MNRLAWLIILSCVFLVVGFGACKPNVKSQPAPPAKDHALPAQVPADSESGKENVGQEEAQPQEETKPDADIETEDNTNEQGTSKEGTPEAEEDQSDDADEPEDDAIVTPPPAKPTKPLTGNVRVTSDPQGAAVLLDGTDTGMKTEAFFTKISPGSHLIEVRKDGYESSAETLNLAAGETALSSHVLKKIVSTGSIRVTSKPSGADILLDGKHVPQTTEATLTDVTAGSHKVEARKEGFERAEQSVQVIAGQTTDAAFSLTATPTPIEEAKHQFIGIMMCKMCHKSEYGDWQMTAHAGAFTTLNGNAAKMIAADRGIDDPTKAPECLACHVAGGRVVDSFKESSYKLEDGVSCEACHGPGKDYSSIKVMKDREAAIAAGLVLPTEENCRICHNERSPTFKGFDFLDAVERLAHP